MNSTGNHNTRASNPRLGTPTPLPTLHDAEQAAFRTGWWNGKVVGFVLGMATAVLLGWLR